MRTLLYNIAFNAATFSHGKLNINFEFLMFHKKNSVKHFENCVVYIEFSV